MSMQVWLAYGTMTVPYSVLHSAYIYIYISSIHERPIFRSGAIMRPTFCGRHNARGGDESTIRLVRGHQWSKLKSAYYMFLFQIFHGYIHTLSAWYPNHLKNVWGPFCVPHLYPIWGTWGTNINVPHFWGTNFRPSSPVASIHERPIFWSLATNLGATFKAPTNLGALALGLFP